MLTIHFITAHQVAEYNQLNTEVALHVTDWHYANSLA
ncbi:hypothetical protein J2Z69_002058 [Paenibacillus shirakamiensis]|uniref:Uncharacterized protein n=1 Tax=Paenibacillus shirakamiensis TaxID=1265935 RepID=A0ABS4JH17_9BACL|nr:hypothetical protein [Paenibacillus shirakamiensis]